MSRSWAQVAVEHKREMRRLMAEVWRRYDRVPQERKRQAIQLIEAWFNEELEYEELLKRLEQLAQKGEE